MVDIIKRQDAAIVCDNPQCDYEQVIDSDCDFSNYLNSLCPKCGLKLLSQSDIDTIMLVKSIVSTINRLFGWIPGLFGQKVEYGNPIRFHAKDGKLTISR